MRQTVESLYVKAGGIGSTTPVKCQGTRTMGLVVSSTRRLHYRHGHADVSGRDFGHGGSSRSSASLASERGISHHASNASRPPYVRRGYGPRGFWPGIRFPSADERGRRLATWWTSPRPLTRSNVALFSRKSAPSVGVRGGPCDWMSRYRLGPQTEADPSVRQAVNISSGHRVFLHFYEDLDSLMAAEAYHGSAASTRICRRVRLYDLPSRPSSVVQGGSTL